MDCPLNYQFSTWKFQAQNTVRTICVQNMFWELGNFMYWTGSNSMNNLLSYCGLVDAKIRASDIDLPVTEGVHSLNEKKILLRFR